MTAVLFIVLLSIIVTIHEFGHFLVAKAFGVYCFEFSIGMGPAIFTRKEKRRSSLSVHYLSVVMSQWQVKPKGMKRIRM